MKAKKPKAPVTTGYGDNANQVLQKGNEKFKQSRQAPDGSLPWVNMYMLSSMLQAKLEGKMHIEHFVGTDGSFNAYHEMPSTAQHQASVSGLCSQYEDATFAVQRFFGTHSTDTKNIYSCSNIP